LKKAIVLLITLTLIIAITSLVFIELQKVNYALKIVEKKHIYIQNKVFIDNITSIINKNRKDINSTFGLETLFLLPIDIQKGGLTTHIEFTSAAKGINPNNILEDTNSSLFNLDYILLFDRILESANVQNREFFIALLEDSLDKDLKERYPGSEIVLYDRRFRQGVIENFDKFKKIIDYYAFITEDGNIYHIKWRKILSFYSKDIDFNYLSPLLLKYMIPSLDKEMIEKVTTKKDNVFSNWKEVPLLESYKKELQKFNISFYVPIIKVKIILKKAELRSYVDFIYDIKKKRINSIEIF